MIYVIGARDEPRFPYVKIGYTAGDPSLRLASLQTACPFKLSILLTMPGERKLETGIHNQLVRYRMQGEWFDLKIDWLTWPRIYGFLDQPFPELDDWGVPGYTPDPC